jgi:hypothetical protein
LVHCFTNIWLVSSLRKFTNKASVKIGVQRKIKDGRKEERKEGKEGEREKKS